jgi:hypothetical protein
MWCDAQKDLSFMPALRVVYTSETTVVRPGTLFIDEDVYQIHASK